ncbi:DHH family phosphoesterase [Candidatus Uhrbacteria bacterium]|nr:DHH family phosphoesterase [Candidatus Uhrbacteria bacterium]
MHQYLFHQMHDRLLRAKRVLLIADERIDGDSLGSSLAVADYLHRLGTPFRVLVSGPVPEKYRFLPHADWCTDDPAVLADPHIDLAVSFDCSNEVYVNRLLSQVPHRPFLINVDHHKTNVGYGDLNLVFVEAPATCEVVHQFFDVNRIVPSKQSATVLLCGIAFDTTVFFNDGTNARAFDAASQLVLHGARPHDVIRLLFRNRTVPALRMWGTALERLRRHAESGCVSTCILRRDIEENDVTDDEVDGLSDFLNVVVNAHTLFVLKETREGGIKVSMRTSVYDVARLARAFGGGGHVKAAGFTLRHACLVPGEGNAWRVASLPRT